jgi:hypothetical protein
MQEHCTFMGALDRHVVWDAPPMILLGRKGYLRCAAYRLWMGQAMGSRWGGTDLRLAASLHGFV